MLKSRTDPNHIRRHLHTNSKKVKPTTYIPPDIKLEPGWDCGDWWRHYYKQYGLDALARITHLTVRTVKKRLRKYNIQRGGRKVKLLHAQYCNYDWLHKHYVELDWGTVRCAKAAGVSPDTITSWLNNFKIQVKTVNVPKIFASRIISTLGETPCITVSSD
jgi:hypothetical protein